MKELSRKEMKNIMAGKIKSFPQKCGHCCSKSDPDNCSPCTYTSGAYRCNKDAGWIKHSCNCDKVGG